jgi:hypothetical protein
VDRADIAKRDVEAAVARWYAGVKADHVADYGGLLLIGRTEPSLSTGVALSMKSAAEPLAGYKNSNSCWAR